MLEPCDERLQRRPQDNKLLPVGALGFQLQSRRTTCQPDKAELAAQLGQPAQMAGDALSLKSGRPAPLDPAPAHGPPW